LICGWQRPARAFPFLKSCILKKVGFGERIVLGAVAKTRSHHKMVVAGDNPALKRIWESSIEGEKWRLKFDAEVAVLVFKLRTN